MASKSKPKTKTQSLKKEKKPADIKKLERSEQLEKGYHDRWLTYQKKSIQAKSKKEQDAILAKRDYYSAKIQVEKAKRKIITTNHFLKSD